MGRARPIIAALLPLLALLGLAPGAARGEKAPMSPQALERTATHVVVGTVRAIYVRRAVEGSYEVTRYAAEVQVLRVEKGEGVSAEAPLVVRYWTQRWRGPGPMPPGTTGHSGIPSEGQTLRLYLARNAYDGFSTHNRDGGFNVVGGNGFAPLAPDEEVPPPSPASAPADAAAGFPDGWCGRWRGDLRIAAPGHPVRTTPMEVSLEPTQTGGRWRLAIRYGDQPVRDYVLVARDVAAGRFEIDEGNGIVLPATWADGELFAAFSVGGGLVTARYGVVEDRMRFELTQVPLAPAVTTGGAGGAPPVGGHPLQVVQRALLTR